MTQGEPTPTASILIPVYNEEVMISAAIDELIRELGEALPDLDYEILITENGSSDRTVELAHELEHLLAHLDRFLGVLEAVLGAEVVFSDADQGFPVHCLLDIEPEVFVVFVVVSHWILPVAD